MLYLAMKEKVEISYNNSKVIYNNELSKLEKKDDDVEDDCYNKMDNLNSDLIKIFIKSN